MTPLERFIVVTLPLMPKFLVSRVAERYVAGESESDALETVRALNRERTMATVDLLGEEVTNREHTSACVKGYVQILDALHQERLTCNVSVKLSSLGLRIDEGLCRENLNTIAERAKRYGNFVRIDMEDHTCTDATLNLYRELQPTLGNLGVVLQAMLYRTKDDIESLLSLKPNVRICKGIYREPETIAWQDAEAVRQSYITCTDRLMSQGCYVGIATHDRVLVDAAKDLVRKHRLSRDRYEFQMLLGVLPDLRRELVESGERMRVYVPYGAEWYAYSLRRIRENPSVAVHVMRSLLQLN